MPTLPEVAFGVFNNQNHAEEEERVIGRDIGTQELWMGQRGPGRWVSPEK